METLTPVISVIVPIYKTPDYLPACIESVFAQTLDGWELILVDDGSPDECGFIADRYAAEYAGSTADKRLNTIIVLHRDNGGLSSARNAGLDAASGRYVMFLDSDDFLERDFLERTVAAAQRGNLDMVVTPTRNVTAEGAFAEDLPKDEYWRSFDGEKYLIRYNVTPRIYRTEFLKDNDLRFSEGELMEDVVFCLAANFLTDRWELLDYHGYCYRLNPSGIVGNLKSSGISDDKIPYRGLRLSIEKVLSTSLQRACMAKGRMSNGGADRERVLEYCTVRILVTILFVFCRKSDVSTVRHMCGYAGELLDEYFPDFVHNPYFNVMGEENVPRFQSFAVWIFKLVYRLHMLTPFAVVYTRL